MASLKKIIANRNNSKKSIGPISNLGKIKSSQNAIKHGLNAEKFVVTKALTERFRKLAIPSMQSLLNKNAKEKREIYKVIESIVPVNNDNMFISSL